MDSQDRNIEAQLWADVYKSVMGDDPTKQVIAKNAANAAVMYYRERERV